MNPRQCVCETLQRLIRHNWQAPEVINGRGCRLESARNSSKSVEGIFIAGQVAASIFPHVLHVITKSMTGPRAAYFIQHLRTREAHPRHSVKF